MTLYLGETKIPGIHTGDAIVIGGSSGGETWDDIDTGLEFRSVSPFTINVASPGWDGAMEYLNSESGWQTWDGSEISSGETATGHYIYIRGTSNTIVSGDEEYKWTLTGNNIECNGNIERLLDYATVKNGLHPTMGEYCYDNMFCGCTSLITAPVLPATTLNIGCYNYMFYGCTSLITAPALPATTLADDCYNQMFYACISLTTVPALPATTLADYCYSFMFAGCTKIKMSATQTGTYTKAYRIPVSGAGVPANGAMNFMFAGTGGTFTGAPTINTTYYLDESNSIISII